MNVDERNYLYLQGAIDRDDIWPKVKEYEMRRFQFRWEFGLDTLPEQSGLITIRGPRQSGKSTWLEMKLLDTLEEYGAGTGFFLNGDFIYSHQEFETKLLELEGLFKKKAKVKRLFIDEISQIRDWQRVLKRLIDSGRLKDVLIVTTGSNAADLLHGTERLPGRKGRLSQTDYLFLPISFKEYWYQVKDDIGTFPSDVLWAYVLSGGSPLAVDGIAISDKLADSFVTLITDWILGDIAQSGRSRIFLLNLLRKLYETSPNPISFTKLAKDAGLANNSAALDYVERLTDLLCILPMMQWDSNKDTTLARKPNKFPFINLPTAWAFHPRSPRYIHEVKNLGGQQRGAMMEWVVAQELWRRQQLFLQKGGSKVAFTPTQLMYWSSKNHEIDFVLPSGKMFEVKAGSVQVQEFSWFHKTFPRESLTVICDSNFETNNLRALNLQDFLLEAESDLYFDSDRTPWLQSSDQL